MGPQVETHRRLRMFRFRRLKKPVLPIGLLCLWLTCFGQGPLRGQSLTEIVPDSLIQEGQRAIYRLDFDEAERIFNGAISHYPEDPAGYAFLAITHWNMLLRAAGNLALDDYATPTPFTRETGKPAEIPKARFEASNERLIEVCDRLLDQDPDNVRALYFKGVAYENAAAQALAIDRQHMNAWSQGNQSVRLHKEVLKRDPTLVDARLTISIQEFARATLPWTLKWIIILFYPGDRDVAIEGIREVMAKGRFRGLDAQVVMALLQAWKGDPQESVDIFNRLRRQFPSNYLLDLNVAGVYLRNLDQPRNALGVYLDLRENLSSKARGLGEAELNYKIGATYYRLREYENAAAALSLALAAPAGEKETIPLSAFLLAQIHDEQGSWPEARKYYQTVLQTATPGKTLREEIRTSEKRLRKLGSVP